MGGVRGTVGPATDLVQRRVDMGQKSTNGGGTVTIQHQRTEEEVAMDPQRNTNIYNAMLEHVRLVCFLYLSFIFSLSFSLALSYSQC